jgi:hypothetical protein
MQQRIRMLENALTIENKGTNSHRNFAFSGS